MFASQENTIFLTDENWFDILLREQIKPTERWVKHVEYLGDKHIFRQHVIYYGLTWNKKLVIRCLDPDCILNKPEEN
jgi:hypothetical protein